MNCLYILHISVITPSRMFSKRVLEIPVLSKFSASSCLAPLHPGPVLYRFIRLCVAAHIGVWRHISGVRSQPADSVTAVVASRSRDFHCCQWFMFRFQGSQALCNVFNLFLLQKIVPGLAQTFSHTLICNHYKIVSLHYSKRHTTLRVKIAFWL